MQMNDKVTQVRAMVGKPATEPEWGDNIIIAYLNIAGRKIINRAFPYDPNTTEVPKKYEILQCEIAVYMLNKRGAEGQTAHSENGISRSYESADVPESMLGGIVPYCGVVVKNEVVEEE